MNNFLLFISQYISPILLALLLIWRFIGKLDWIFPTAVITTLSFIYLPDISFPKWQSGSNELKKEIIRLCKMDKEEIEEIMERRGVKGDIIKDGILVYPGDQHGDYKKFYLKKDMRFIIAFEHPHEYDEFCASVDSLMVRKGKIIGCRKDTAYQLSPDCFVCKNGFNRNMDRFVLKVSRSLNFTTPNLPQPGLNANKKPFNQNKDFQIRGLEGIKNTLYPQNEFQPPPPPPMKKGEKPKKENENYIEVTAF